MQITKRLRRLSDYVERETAFWDFSGVIQVIKDGEPVFSSCRGYASHELGVKNTLSTRFSAASVTKQLTAFAILLLCDRGLIDLQADANRYLDAKMQIPAGITVHHLLSHCSGLYNFYNFEDDFYIGADRLPFDKKAFFRDWINRRPVTPAGEKFGYNNANYNLLAWIIENTAEQLYDLFLRQNIFLPLDMQGAQIDNGLNLLSGRAQNYMHDYGQTVRTPYSNPLFHIGAGGLVIDSASLQKWYHCLRERRLLSERAYKRFFTENSEHYCYGLERHSENGRVKYAHGGDMNGTAAYVQYFFEDDLCLLILSNNESLNQYRLGNAMADILYGNAPPFSGKPPEIPLSEKQLHCFAGTYLPGKVWIEVRDDKLYLVRVNQNIHIELYCTGPDTFVRRWEESAAPYVLRAPGEETPSVWGFHRVSEAFI